MGARKAFTNSSVRLISYCTLFAGGHYPEEEPRCCSEFEQWDHPLPNRPEAANNLLQNNVCTRDLEASFVLLWLPREPPGSQPGDPARGWQKRSGPRQSLPRGRAHTSGGSLPGGSCRASISRCFAACEERPSLCLCALRSAAVRGSTACSDARAARSAAAGAVLLSPFFGAALRSGCPAGCGRARLQEREGAALRPAGDEVLTPGSKELAAPPARPQRGLGRIHSVCVWLPATFNRLCVRALAGIYTRSNDTHRDYSKPCPSHSR
ncbi:uncharacterized protein LOC110403891 [Numida meleagris]|uniref:uncharacterized protein LOC110403891 n=1 Tax=Numida meleagris TaxID=8996 RepID=UPI000B3DDB59|nr:uncharacterized protein LOC110403891 [Numida meleagris]